jgi:hypothetical protein
VIFGRQKNLVRRPVRPDGRFTRDIRRRGVGRASLLDLPTARKPLLVRIVGGIVGVFRRK